MYENRIRIEVEQMDNLISIVNALNQNNDEFIIMCGNTEVLSVDLEVGSVNVLNEILLPFRMKNAFMRVPNFIDVKTEFDDRRRQKAISNNKNVIIDWLSSRVLLLSRKNAKKLYQAFRLPQNQDDMSRARLSLMCRALSILDNYWVKYPNETLRWEDVNLKHRSLNESIAQIALYGTNVSLQGSMESPEFTTNGAYAKAWHRDADGSLWLYKLNDKENTAKIEICVSNILDCFNVDHVKYEKRYSRGNYVCACKCISSDRLSIMDGQTFKGYCNRSGIDMEKYLIHNCRTDFYNMLIVDYLIANPDRHDQNWGMYYNPENMEILGMHSLFDHNNAFDESVMNNDDYQSHFFNGKSMKDVAMHVIKNTNIKVVKSITKDLFLNNKQYEVFLYRCKQLNIL